MKKLLCLIFSLALCISLASCNGLPCDHVDEDGDFICDKCSSHLHNYNCEVIESAYLVSGATCAAPATYRYSCSCGEAGSEVFSYGEPTDNHIYNGTQSCDVCGTHMPFTDGIEYTVSDDGTYAEVTGYHGTSSEFVIADNYYGTPVTSISGNANLHSHPFITSISIPSTVVSIGSMAFADCQGITSVVVPDSVTTLGYRAFSGCCELESIVIGSGVAEIGESVFEGCFALESITVLESNAGFKSVDGNLYSKDGKILYNYAIGKTDTSFTIPDGVETVGSDAFFSSEYLTEIIIPSGVRKIGAGAFYRCKITSITIPSTVKTIEDHAFSECESLATITLSSGIEQIGNAAFGTCKSLQSIVIPNSVTDIGSGAFSGCESLDSLTLPYGIRYIGHSAFSGCVSLMSVVIPDTVEKIWDHAFGECRSLMSIVIGSGVEEIQPDAFLGCPKLVEVINKSRLDIKKVTDPYDYDRTYLTTNAIEVHRGTSKIVNRDGYIFYTYNGVNYLFDYRGADTVLTLPEDYNGESYEIYKYAFRGRDDITAIVFSDGITRIGEFAFAECNGLTSVSVPGIITEYDNGIFVRCENLVSVSIEEGATAICIQMFKYCYSLESVIIPESIRRIEPSAFEECTSLLSVTLSDGVQYVGSRAFANCTSLATVTVGKGIQVVNGEAFENCTALTGVYISDVGVWCDIAFDYSYTANPLYYAKNLYLDGSLVTELVIPANLRAISPYTFVGCTSITKVIISYDTEEDEEEGDDDIGFLPGGFNGGLSGGSSGNISGSVENYNGIFAIERSAFEGCTGITTVIIPECVRNIDFNAFAGCTSLTAINYCGSEEEWSEMYRGEGWDSGTGNYTVTYNYLGE